MVVGAGHRHLAVGLTVLVLDVDIDLDLLVGVGLGICLHLMLLIRCVVNRMLAQLIDRLASLAGQLTRDCSTIVMSCRIFL